MHTATELLLSQPGLVFAHLARHAGHYATLTQLEAELAAAQWVRRAVTGAVALLAAMLAVGLAGVAVMLGASHAATLGNASMAAGWPLAYWLVPALPALLAVGAAAYAVRRPPPAFAMLREQLGRDMQLLAPEPALPDPTPEPEPGRQSAPVPAPVSAPGPVSVPAPVQAPGQSPVPATESH